MNYTTKLNTVVVSVILILLAGVVVFGLSRQNQTADAEQKTHAEDTELSNLSGSLKDGKRVIEMTAEKFRFTPEKITVEKGDTVRIDIISKDVKHGLQIKAFNVNEEISSEEPTIIEFKADKAGTFHFHCSVYCGSGHKNMHGKLIVREK